MFGLVLGATVVLLVFSSLPLLVEYFVLPSLLDRAGLSQYQVAVSRFGPGSASFHISAKSADGLITGGTLRVRWTVSGLLQRRLNRVVLDGLLVNLPLGGRPEKDTQKVSSLPRVPSEPSGIPVIVEEIQVVNTVIVLRDKGRVTSLPVSFSAQLLNTEKGADSGTLRYRTNLNVAEYGVGLTLGCVDASVILEFTTVKRIDEIIAFGFERDDCGVKSSALIDEVGTAAAGSEIDEFATSYRY